METNRLTGEQLFLRYAFPCAEGRVLRGKLDESHYEKLKAMIASGAEPDRHILRYAFPHAFRRLREFAAVRNLERWEFGTVASFWREHHGHEGACAIRRARVVSADARAATVRPQVVQLSTMTGNERAFNFYGLALEAGDEVYLHFSVVIEKI